MKILVCDKVAEAGVGILRAEPDFELVESAGHSADELKEMIRDCDGIIIRSASKLTADVLERAGRLRVIVRAGAGVDNIDVGAASKRGIIVMNTPGGNTTSTAEHTFALMLGMSRNVHPAAASLEEGRWDRKLFTGTQLAGKTLGVIGLGRVGKEVVRRALAFQMQVIGYDPYLAGATGGELGIEVTEDLDDVLRRADYVTVHTPLNDETRGLVNAEKFAIMKEGVRIVNCARGGIVDEDDLLTALESGIVASAALDVYTSEPPANRALVEHPRVLATPHLAASTEEAQLQVALDAARQMIDALKGAEVRFAVNMPAFAVKAARGLAPLADLAHRLGELVVQLTDGRIRRIEVAYAGEAAKQDTRTVTTELLVAVLRQLVDVNVNFVNASLLAEEAGITVDETRSSASENFVTLVTVTAHTDSASTSASGTLFGRAEPRLVSVGGFEVEVSPRGEIVLVYNTDRPGLIGEIGKILGDAQINIARMTFGRKEEGGEAITVLNVDAPVPEDVLDKVRGVRSVHAVETARVSQVVKGFLGPPEERSDE